MLDERDEFLLSRVTDGDLSAEECARVEALLAESEEAREVLRGYRQLSGVLRLGRETPELDYEGMRQEISAATERAAERAAVRGMMEDEETFAERTAIAERGRWMLGGAVGGAVRVAGRRLALAAAVLMAAGVSWQFYRSTPGLVGGGEAVVTGGAVIEAGGVMVVRGPVAEAGTGTGVVEIQIGPSAALAARGAANTYQEKQPQTQTRVAITPEVLSVRSDDGRLPF